MKKIDLVHTTILIIALLTAFSGLEQVIGFLAMLSYPSDIYYMRGMAIENIIFSLIGIGLYVGAFIFLIKKGRNLAATILKDEPEASWEDAAQVQLDRRNIIFVLFLGMGLHSLIQSVPYLIRDLYELFKNRVATDLFRGPKPDARTVVVESLKVLLGTFLIYAAAPLTNFIDKNIASKLKSDS